MLRRFSGLSCGKYCFYSLIFAFIISLGCINTANAYVCFLPDSSDCAQGDTEGFWPCVGSDCEGGENSKCDASYNSRMSTNECGAACTRCNDASSPYNGLYKCPENTCNCNEYTSTEAFNECGDSCKVCRIAGDKNYGNYKCPAVPASGCSNPQCEDYTLTKSQADNITANGGVCEQCTNKNAPISRQKLFKCEDCNPDIYTNTLEGCKKKGYDSAKDKCPTGDVYQTCCNTCDGHIFPTDLSKTSEGWSCTPCPNSCDGGTKYSCGCKEGYHSQSGECVKEECNFIYRKAEINVDYTTEFCNYISPNSLYNGNTTCNNKPGCSPRTCGLHTLDSVYVIFGGTSIRVYNKIDRTSKTCKKDNKTYYEKICDGTPKGYCANKFIPNGCKSESYTQTRSSSQFIVGDEYGTCCSSDEAYIDMNTCKSETGKNCYQQGKCWASCESTGYYSSKSACETKNDINAGDCIEVFDYCYIYKADYAIVTCDLKEFFNDTDHDTDHSYSGNYGGIVALALEDSAGKFYYCTPGNKSYVPAGMYKVYWKYAISDRWQSGNGTCFTPAFTCR